MCATHKRTHIVQHEQQNNFDLVFFVALHRSSFHFTMERIEARKRDLYASIPVRILSEYVDNLFVERVVVYGRAILPFVAHKCHISTSLFSELLLLNFPMFLPRCRRVL